MKVILQRVSSASVTVDGKTVGVIDAGLLLLLGFGKEDDESRLAAMAQKIATLRVFADERQKFQFSLLDIKGGALLVPQFTLFADTSKGRRPEFFSAMEPQKAASLFSRAVQVFKAAGIEKVEQGVFGAHMHVQLVNDGPVTIILEN